MTKQVKENMLNIISEVNDKKSTIDDSELVDYISKLSEEIKKINLFSRCYLTNDHFVLKVVDNEGNVIIPCHMVEDFSDEGQSADGLYYFSANFRDGEVSKHELMSKTIEKLHKDGEFFNLRLSIIDKCGVTLYEVNYEKCLFINVNEPHFNYRDDSVSLFRIKGTYQNKSKKYYV